MANEFKAVNVKSGRALYNGIPRGRRAWTLVESSKKNEDGKPLKWLVFRDYEIPLIHGTDRDGNAIETSSTAYVSSSAAEILDPKDHHTMAEVRFGEVFNPETGRWVPTFFANGVSFDDVDDTDDDI